MILWFPMTCPCDTWRLFASRLATTKKLQEKQEQLIHTSWSVYMLRWLWYAVDIGDILRPLTLILTLVCAHAPHVALEGNYVYFETHGRAYDFVDANGCNWPRDAYAMRACIWLFTLYLVLFLLSKMCGFVYSQMEFIVLHTAWVRR